MSPRVLHTKFCRCIALAVRLYHKRLCNVTKKLGFFKLFRNLHTTRSACTPITYILLFHMPAYSSIHLFNIRLIYALVLLCAYSANALILQFSYSEHTHILLFAYSARAHKKASHKKTGIVRTLRVQFTRETDRTLSTTASIRSWRRSAFRRSRPSHC